MSKQILIETQLFNQSILTLTEGKTSKRGNPIVEGLLATAEIKNGNGRYYPEQLWKREIDKYMINLKNVSHNITDIWWDGDKIMGKIEILPTPSGNILKALFESGIKVGVSSRGMGSLKENDGVLEVQDDFDLLCWDFVSTPSNPGSWMSPLREGIDYSNLPNPYKNVQNIITDILCSQGNCPIF